MLLEVSTCTVPQELILSSPDLQQIEDGSFALDFGSVSVGEKKLVSATVKNISCSEKHLKAAPLDPLGPFW